ncbi:MAG: prepilin peptidase [Microvirga sp.]|nr:prepilin peptidase [Microvirga sp.]
MTSAILPYLIFAVPGLIILAAIYDMFTMTIPNAISLALLALFVVIAPFVSPDWTTPLMHLGAGALVLAVGIGLFAMGWVGGGDVKLAAATVLWIGFGGVLEYLFVAALAGGLLTLAILALRRLPLPATALAWGWLDRLHDSRNGVPYGIALAAAAIVVLPATPLWLGAVTA